jgi:hypothetical protein
MDFSDLFSMSTMNIVIGIVILLGIGALVFFMQVRDGFQNMTDVAGGAAIPTKMSAPKDTCEVVKKQLDVYVDLKNTHETPIDNIDNTISQMKEALKNYGCEKYFSIE